MLVRKDREDARLDKMYVANLTGANNNLKEYVMSPTDQFLEVPLKHS